MKKRWIFWSVWLAAVFCLYFFENNAGTLAVLCGSLALPFLEKRETEKEEAKAERPVIRRELLPGKETEFTDIRPYRPGDPLRRIHWKLSEKMNETLIRESAPEALDPAVLLLETAGAGMPDPEAADAAARALLSVSRAMAEAGIAHAVITSGNGGPAVTAVMGEDGFRQADPVLQPAMRSGATRKAV